MYKEEINLDYIYDDDIILDDLTDEEYDYLEENDPDRLAEISGNTNDYYNDLMFPDGNPDDD